MNRNPQYDYIAKLHGREAAEQWLQKKKLEEARNQNILNQYGPPQLTPDQMVRVAQKSMGDIPGGLLSEEGPGQMPSPSPLEGAYVNKILSQQDMWSKQARLPSSFKDPYQNAQMNPLPEQYAGTSIPPPPQYAGSPASPHERGYVPFSGESIPFDHPSIAGERITDHPKFNNVAGLLETSPEQMRAMQDQIGGPGFWDPPRFAAANQAQMGMGLTKSDRSDPNFYAPEFTRSGTPGGMEPEQNILAEVPDNEETGWYRDDRLNPDKRRKLKPEWWRLINQGMNIYGG